MVYISYAILFMVTIYCLRAIRFYKRNPELLQQSEMKHKNKNMEMSLQHQDQKNEY